MKSNYISIMMMKQALKKIIKKEEFEKSIRKNLDSRFIKFINIKRNTIILRANKKLREKSAKDVEFLTQYIYKFLTSVIKEFNNDIEESYLEIICDLYVMTDDYKIYIKIL